MVVTQKYVLSHNKSCSSVKITRSAPTILGYKQRIGWDLDSYGRESNGGV